MRAELYASREAQASISAEVTQLRRDLDNISALKESESVARANDFKELEVCRTQMYEEYDSKKDVRDERNVLRYEVTKLQESVAKQTDFEY